MAWPLIKNMNAVCVVAALLLIVAIADADTPPGIANNPSHARCLIKKYKHCYNLEHVCPKFCPDSCHVECVSCKPICGPGSAPPPDDAAAPPPPTTSPPPDKGKSPPPSDDGKSSPPPPTSSSPPPPSDDGKSSPPSKGKGDDDGADGKGKGDDGDEGKGKGDDGGDDGKGKGDDGKGKGDDGKSSPPPSPPSTTPTPSPSPPPYVKPPSPTPSPPTTPPATPTPSPSPPPPSTPPSSPPPAPSTPTTPPSSPTPTPPASPPPPYTPPSSPAPTTPPASPPSTPPASPPPSSPTPTPPPSTPPASPPSSTPPSSPTPTPPPASPPSTPPASPPPSSPTPTPPPSTPPSSTPTTPPSSPPPPYTPPSSPTPSPPTTPPSSPPATPPASPPSSTPTTPPSSPTPTPPTPPAPYSPPPPAESGAGLKRQRCKNRNYPQCYGVEHVCPSSCPTTCEVDCVTCKPVCKCDMPGAVCQDPRFIGGDGITFYFHGKKDRDFCLVTDPNLHINAHFIGRRNQYMKRDFTWVQSIAVLFGDHQLFIGAQKTAAWDDSVDRFSLSFDGEPIALSAAEGATWQPAALPTATVTRDSDTNSVVIQVEGLFKISAKVVPITQHESRVHNYGITEDDCFAHLELGFKFSALNANVNGVLGQTYREKYVSRVKMGVAMPVLGGEREFAVSNIFATDCAVSLFHGGELLPENDGADVLELPTMKCGTGIGGRGVVCKR